MLRRAQPLIRNLAFHPAANCSNFASAPGNVTIRTPAKLPESYITKSPSARSRDPRPAATATSARKARSRYQARQTTHPNAHETSRAAAETQPTPGPESNRRTQTHSPQNVQAFYPPQELAEFRRRHAKFRERLDALF